ncbi:uncharacterized protein wu:fj29h11 isoform X3 [Gadus macrocephalus]|uniref:uncharacterized protein wu:fj29h11 isoform X3 n=1 Tax=Gadus macrocephalus TaxID=80720 RepID=UPI0028CB6B2D|nr:uncharacterized protein wu:fj29h11 isoform X3 [Gadus macrocephalus]
MEEIQKEVVRLCNGYPEGLPIQEIHGLYQRTYGKPLRLGTPKRFAPLQTLLRSVPDHLYLCTDGEMVVWPIASRPSASRSAPSFPSPPAALAAAARGPRLASPRNGSSGGKATTIMGETREEIVAMIKGFPGGVPGKKVAEQYNRTYHKNLTVASLGFKSMALLLASLDKELVVQGELVFHRSHWPPGVADTALEAGDGDQSTAQEAGERPSVSALGDGQPAKARKKRHRSGRGASPAPPAGQPLEVSSSSGGVPSFGVYQAPLGKHSVPAGAGEPVETLSQDQLLQRITQVMKEDKLAGGSMARLAESYSERFGEALPLEQYMTLYDTWDSRRPGRPSGASAEAAEPRRPVPTQHTEAPTTSSIATTKDFLSFGSLPSNILPLMPAHSLASGLLPSGALPSEVPYPQPFGSRHTSSLFSNSLFSDSLFSSSMPAGTTPTSSLFSGPRPTNSLFSSSVPAGTTPTSSLFSGPRPTNSLFSSSVPAGTTPTNSLFSGPRPTNSLFSSSVPAGTTPTNSLFSSSVPAGTTPTSSLFSGPRPTGTTPTSSLFSGPTPAASLPSKVAPPVAIGSLPIKPPPAGPSDEDFPALGAVVAREPRRATPTRPPLEETRKNSPVFRDDYHGQLRHVHAANRRAAEVLEADNEDAKGRKRNRVLDPETVNSLVEGVIRDLADEGEFVTQEKVVSKVCMLMQVPSLRSVGIFQAWHIPAVKELQYTIREINMFLESTEAATAICTLYELGLSLAGLKEKKRYEELNLGPLCKLPIVHRMFKIDSSTKDDDIPQIETVDILKSLRHFRHTEHKQKVDLAEFMKHLADQHSCESPYELGIRIQSLGLPIATLNKVIRLEHQNLERAQHLIQRELEEEVTDKMRKMKKNVMDPFSAASFGAGSLELRKKYISMAAVEVVLEVFTNAADIFSSKLNKRVQDFLLQVSGDRLCSAMFQLAICGGSLAVPQDLVAKDQPAKAAGKPATHEPAVALPSEDAVKQFLRTSLSNQSTALSLSSMASLEKKLSSHFKLPEFGSLQRGTFLEFLVKNVQLLQETVGGAVALGGGGGAELQGCGFRPSRQDVFEFIKQCGAFTSSEPDALVHIERALRAHYRVRDSRDLGFGPLKTLADLVKRQRDLLGGGACVQVHYETALFAKHSSTTDVCGASVGLLGEVSQDQALACLLSCPLLEDLEQWSQWEVVFRPVHGPLKDFIERNAAVPANSDLAALEVSPGVLLRITTATGDKLFSQAATNLDPVGTAGHLVSMAVADGVVNVSTALLANHMESALAAGVANADMSQGDDDVSSYGSVPRFLLESITRIPPMTCQALLQQVFLEPLYRVLGQASSKALLLAVARSDPRHLNRLHQLAIRLGVTEWIKDYQKKMDPPKPRDTLTATKPDLMDSFGGSLSALNLNGDDDYLDDPAKEDSSETSSLNRQRLPAESEREEDDVEEEEEPRYELVNKETHSDYLTASECDGGRGMGEAELSETDGVTVEKEEEEGEDAADTEGEENFERALIEDIRKSQFGVGVELTAECKKLMAVQQERLGRSLDRLSTELYSKDAHFVLELIQNADDNTYPLEGGVVPALVLVVEKNCITVLNNERGFQDQNIRAICDVGRSTKGKHKYGYIGQKGIGFKSVFKVTDRPEIHSNGFHLRFDKKSGPMGYILPHWVEEERPLDLQQIPSIGEHSWTTKICLPLRSESQQTRNLFHDVHPSLLLFLHRLRSITIYNQCERRVVAMTRRDRSHNVLEVEHTEGTERWLVIKRTLEPKKIKEEVESTELALAFLLGDSSLPGDIITQPQKQPVFAFLPLRSFGFRFIVQGDFDIPSSREDVDRDSPWNQWLRSEIPQLFVQALNVFNDHPEFSGMKGLVHFLQFVPLPDEVLDFFKPVARQIIQLLKGQAFLPTLNSEREVEYKLPSQVAVCQDSVIRNVIGREELDRHLSLAYLHPSLQPLPPLSLLTHLGVRHLRGSDVTTVTTAMARELTAGGELHTDEGLRRLSRLLVCNFRALEYGYGEEEQILQALRELPIIPLADGRVVALSSVGVFFPMEKAEKKKGKQKPAGPFAALYEDVSVVHPSLLACEAPLEAQQVRELLKRMGVHELEPQQLLEKHIYPALRDHSWKAKPEAVVVSYLVFIKQHSSASSWPLLDTAVPVRTSRGLLCPQLHRVHFSSAYNNVDLTKILPGCDWLLLSPCYVETDGDVEGWREFFSALGVRDNLIIRKERRTLSPSELAASPWAVGSDSWPQGTAEGGYVMDDYPCQEFHSLATAELPDRQLVEQRRALLGMLEDNWEKGDRYSQYITAQVVDADGQPAKTTKSSFFHFLSRLPWVPAYRLLEGGERQVQYLVPDAVYLVSPEVHGLLGVHVCYVEKTPSELSRKLGMKHSVSVEEMISYLKTWSSRPEETEAEGRPGPKFTSTVQHVFNVYSYLQKNCSQGALKELFEHTPAVYVEHDRREDGWTSGVFYHLKEVCWSDPTHMFKRYKQLVRAPDSPMPEPRQLAPFYSPLDGMRELFTRQLNVEPSPTMFQYVCLLELVCASCPMPTAEVLQDVSVIYARKCKTTTSPEQDYMDPGQPRTISSYCSTLKGMVLDKKVFPTKAKSWVTLARRPMVADDRELEKIFKLHPGVCLLNLPPPGKKHGALPRGKPGDHRGPAFQEEDRALFLEICGVRLLSDCVRSEPQTENLRACPAVQALVRAVMPYVQRFLCAHEELAAVYRELQDAGVAQTLRNLQYRQVGKLYIRYQLSVGGGGDPPDPDQEQPLLEMQDVVCLLRDDKELYIQKDHLTAHMDICRELVKLFCVEKAHRKELIDFLSGLMTSLDDPASLKRFLKREDVQELPKEEVPWEVPEPPRPELPPAAPRPLAPPEEAPRREEDGEQTLACWPPKASMGTVATSGRTGARNDSDAVDAVMKMWPPPAPPKDQDLDRGDRGPASSGTGVPQGPQGPPHSGDPGAAAAGQPRPASDQPRPGSDLPRLALDHAHTGSPGAGHAGSSQSSPGSEGGQREGHPPGPGAGFSGGERPVHSGPPPDQPKTDSDQCPAAVQPVPELVVTGSTFQGTEGVSQRPPLAMDFPQWNKSALLELEDMELACTRPTTVVLTDVPGDLAAIGAWGEQLVHSFLCHWRDGDAADRPSEVTWCNQQAESGQPYDFKLTFPAAAAVGAGPQPGAEGAVVYVEVKSTVKRDKAFIHLSANELDFALTERERYHILRVYSVGDAQNVRLCRVRNLAQKLHAKDLELFLFI